eukprot:scaffold2265_cov98-Skeletonema_dohrnii-CCMP3373.AAC.2
MAFATVAHGFSTSPSSARRSVVSQLAMKSGGMDSYEAQLTEAVKLLASAESSPAPSPVNGAATTSTAAVPSVDEIAAAMLASSRAAVTTAQPAPQTIVIRDESSKEGNGLTSIIYAGIAFIGLPIWLLLSSMITPSNQQSSVMAPAAPTPTATNVAAPSAGVMSLPSSVASSLSAPSAANSAGVVVLSQPITKAEVRNLFNLWNAALATGDPATVAKRYSKEGVLLPTLSDVPRNDFEGIKDYFVHFLEKKPTGKILEGEIFVGNNWAQDAGIYEFTFADGSKVKARYSFVYVYENGEWMISHHHSSLMPEEVVRPKAITKDEVRGLFNLWNDALATGDPQQVAARYTEDAVLLPTLSDKARNVKIGPNWAQDAGIYEFTFQDGSAVQGRYSFVYAYENGQWKISNHHSSIMPEGAVAAMKKVASMEK